jgi:hypothetical protein
VDDMRAAVGRAERQAEEEQRRAACGLHRPAVYQHHRRELPAATVRGPEMLWAGVAMGLVRAAARRAESASTALDEAQGAAAAAAAAAGANGRRSMGDSIAEQISEGLVAALDQVRRSLCGAWQQARDVARFTSRLAPSAPCIWVGGGGPARVGRQPQC